MQGTVRLVRATQPCDEPEPGPLVSTAVPPRKIVDVIAESIDIMEKSLLWCICCVVAASSASSGAVVRRPTARRVRCC